MPHKDTTHRAPSPLAAFEPTPPARRPVRPSPAIGALSHARDLTEGQPAGHCMRKSGVGTAIDPGCLEALWTAITDFELG